MKLSGHPFFWHISEAKCNLTKYDFCVSLIACPDTIGQNQNKNNGPSAFRTINVKYFSQQLYFVARVNAVTMSTTNHKARNAFFAVHIVIVVTLHL
jgi:hypothetical protein